MTPLKMIEYAESVRFCIGCTRNYDLYDCTRSCEHKDFFDSVVEMAKTHLPKEPTELEKKSIGDMEWSVRAYNLLARNGIRSYADLSKLTVPRLKRFRNVGAKLTKEIVLNAHKYGIDIEGGEAYWQEQT